MKTLIIEGMMCERCLAHVQKALEQIGSDVVVSLQDGKATLNTSKTNEEIIAAIEEAGYEVKEIL